MGENTLSEQFQHEIERSLEIGKIDTNNKQIHNRLFSLLDKATSVKSGGIELVLCAQMETGIELYC